MAAAKVLDNHLKHPPGAAHEGSGGVSLGMGSSGDAASYDTRGQCKPTCRLVVNVPSMSYHAVTPHGGSAGPVSPGLRRGTLRSATGLSSKTSSGSSSHDSLARSDGEGPQQHQNNPHSQQRPWDAVVSQLSHLLRLGGGAGVGAPGAAP